MGENIALTEAVYYILLSLNTPLHGYGIMQMADELSNGRVKLAAGTLYGALNTLCDKGWIKELPTEAGSRRKEYCITESGKKVLLDELDRLRQLVNNGEMILNRRNTYGTSDN
ncbi:MAG: PadR family transcriptional regulator [Lachnospira sp.]|nr:PadR family transcriptional regulator [Lachnospira sp.]